MDTFSSTALLGCLQENVRYTNSALQAARLHLQAFDERLHWFNVPLHFYPQQVLRLRAYLQKEANHAHHHFLKAVGASQQNRPTRGKQAEPEPAAPPAAAEPKPEPARELPENIYITIEDGQTISKHSVGPQRWLEVLPIPRVPYYVVHFYFPEAVIPAEYAFVLKHKGYRFPPTTSVYIAYSAEEFQRLCQLQIDTNSPHFPDGQRLKYWRLKDTESINDEPEEE